MTISGCQPREGGDHPSFLLLFLALVLFAASASAQERSASSASPALPEFPQPASLDQQSPPNASQPQQSGTSSAGGNQKQSTEKAGDTATPKANPQPPRILGIMPNFRAVSAGVIPPPPTPKQAFVIATKNSFDYSSFIFVGITSRPGGGNKYARATGQRPARIREILLARVRR